ncbi:MAG: 2-oxo-4-hydroxy-4-carboxy-5-ureidoimidazoline decarboxylase [Burkholderiaceae bacterium]
MTAVAPPPDLNAINRMDRDAFVAALGSTFEHSPWVAVSAWQARPFASTDALHDAMIGVVLRASQQQQIAFLCGHPELAGKEAQAGAMTDESVGEQSSAGLDALSRAEIVELAALNASYRSRHGFPFIIAVRRYRKAEIFEQLRLRLERDSDTERLEAMAQIGVITRLRIDAKLAR